MTLVIHIVRNSAIFYFKFDDRYLYHRVPSRHLFRRLLYIYRTNGMGLANVTWPRLFNHRVTVTVHQCALRCL